MTVIELEKGSCVPTIWARLRKAGARSVDVHVEGVVCSLPTGRAGPFVRALTKQLAVRVVVDDQGVAKVFPRPYVEVTAEGVHINGSFATQPWLDQYTNAWPQLGDALKHRLSGFVVES